MTKTTWHTLCTVRLYNIAASEIDIKLKKKEREIPHRFQIPLINDPIGNDRYCRDFSYLGNFPAPLVRKKEKKKKL